MLEIEWGQVTQLISPFEKRHCPECNVIEIEIHCVLECIINQNKMLELFDKIRSMDSYFNDLQPANKFVDSMNTQKERNMKCFAKFVYTSFDKRTKFLSSPI